MVPIEITNKLHKINVNTVYSWNLTFFFLYDHNFI